MSKKSNPVRSTLMIVGGVLGMLLLFSVVLRAALAPLYQDVAMMQSREGGGGYSGGGGGGESYSGGASGGSNVNIDLGGLGGLLNWALGWAWGGPGWYNAHPGGGWWGGNWWNNWNGSWDHNGNWYDANGNRVFNNDTFNRTVNRDNNFDRAVRDESHGGDEFRREEDRVREGGFHGGGGEHFHGGGGGFHGGGRR
ncbi:MAG: hypothetical protein FGM15_00805 [Chthoniobacterales bacterium]|nr:hypothetical protein [Chthoniobacterales bacterium]